MAVPQRVLDIMQSGDVYLCDDEEMLDAQRAQLELLYDFNATRPGEAGRRATLLQRLLGGIGEGLVCRTAAARELGVQHVHRRAVLRELQPDAGR